MSRAVIGAAVAVLIAAFTSAVYLIATSKLESRIRKDLQVRVANARDLLIRNSETEMLGLLKRTEELSRDERLVRALEGEEGLTLPDLAVAAFQDYRQALPQGKPRPDVLSLVDSDGRVVALMSGDKTPKPIPDLYKDKDGELRYPAIDLALASEPDRRQAISEIWNYQGSGPMKAAVAPIVDLDFNEVPGAVIVAYAVTSAEAADQRDLLGAEVAYFFGDRIHASSFGDSLDPQEALSGPLFSDGLAAKALESKSGIADLTKLNLAGSEYLATAGRLPRFPRQPLPESYPAPVAGAAVTMSVSDALAPLFTVKLAILLLGAGAIVIALLVMTFTAKSILAPIDDIEVGISEIINGNTDRTFRPGSPDTEGLANALNVMLARLLGRPEPGEEEYDEAGNIVTSSLEFESEGLSPQDSEALELAREPEGQYYQRLFDEYVAARKAAGQEVESVTREGFVGKVRLNEANLKSKYDCQAVRFKVVSRDGKVTLKPVPIA